MRKFAEEYRERLLVKFTRKYASEKPSEVLEAEKIIAKYREEQKNIEPTLSRLNSFECPDFVCPDCFWTKSVTVHTPTSYMAFVSCSSGAVNCASNLSNCVLRRT